METYFSSQRGELLKRCRFFVLLRTDIYIYALCVANTSLLSVLKYLCPPLEGKYIAVASFNEINNKVSFSLEAKMNPISNKSFSIYSFRLCFRCFIIKQSQNPYIENFTDSSQMDVLNGLHVQLIFLPSFNPLKTELFLNNI